MHQHTSSEYWPTSGNDHQQINPERLFRDNHIDHFLNSVRCTYLIATKGMGKTLLLRTRKQRFETIEKGMLVIPRHTESDKPAFLGELAESVPDELQKWQELWTVSILLSILSHHLPPTEGVESVKQLHALILRGSGPDAFLDALLKPIELTEQRNPSYFLGLLLQKGGGALKRVLKLLQDLEPLSNRYIQNGVCIFIDAVDTALTEKYPKRLSLWKHAQNGLLLAA